MENVSLNFPGRSSVVDEQAVAWALAQGHPRELCRGCLGNGGLGPPRTPQGESPGRCWKTPVRPYLCPIWALPWMKSAGISPWKRPAISCRLCAGKSPGERLISRMRGYCYTTWNFSDSKQSLRKHPHNSLAPNSATSDLSPLTRVIWPEISSSFILSTK